MHSVHVLCFIAAHPGSELFINSKTEALLIKLIKLSDRVQEAQNCMWLSFHLVQLCILKNKGDVMSENTIGSWIIPKDVGETMIDSVKEKI